MGDHVFSETCPHCCQRNWINNGDITDVSDTDVEAYRCWNCKEVSLVEGADEFTTLEDAWLVDGLRVLQ